MSGGEPIARIAVEGAALRLEGGGDMAAALERLGRPALVEALGRELSAEARRRGAAGFGPAEARRAAERIADRLMREARGGGG